MTETDGSKQYYVFYDEVISGSSLYTKIPTAFGSDQIPDYSLGAPSFDTTDVTRNQHNTHHWNRQQSAALSDPNPLSFSAADYKLSTTMHWLGKAGHPSGISSVLGWILPPSRNGTLEDLPTFYDYEGKDPGAGYTYSGRTVDYREFAGTSRKANVISQRRPDGTTWWQETTYNGQRKKLSVSENWADGGALKTRASSYRYASATGDPTIDDIVLIEEKGPSGELIGGRKLHATYKDLTIELTNAVGEITVMTYNANRQLATEQSAAGLLNTFTYFTDGRLQKVLESQAGINLRTNSYTWLNGLRRTHVDPRNLTRTFDYDFLGRLTKITYGSDSTTEEFFYVLPANTGFNTTASLINVLDQVGRKDRLGYGWTNIPNRLRQVEKQIEPPRVAGQSGVENTITYCGCGSPSSITKASNKAEAETTTYDFDYQGKPTAIYLPGSVTLTREYDRIGRLYKETDRNGA